VTLVEATCEHGVGTLTLTRPGKRNALNHALVDEAVEAVDSFVRSGARVAVLASTPPIFCAGNDTTEIDDVTAPAASTRLLETLLTQPLTWIAAIEGGVLGAGVSVIAACPLAFAADDAWFAMPERELGIFPAGVLAYLEPLIGVRRAFEAALTGSRVDAPAAAAAGLVTAAVPAAELHAHVDRYAATLAERPELTDSARRAWQARFRTAAAAERVGELEENLRSQLVAREAALTERA
jgi:methylglutaconyl-CoA hydratase